MKTQYKISDNYLLDLEEGYILERNNRVIGITAYQERFLKYLIRNQNTLCINGNIKDFVYRGETLPRETPDFFRQLTQVCPDLRERISVHKYALMDIGYQYKLPNVDIFSNLWPEKNPQELDVGCIPNDEEMMSTIQRLQNSLTPEQRTVLKILMLHHDKPLSYQTIIKLSHAKAAKGERSLKNTYEIIRACNDLLDMIPELSEALQPVFVHTVAYMYQPFQENESREDLQTTVSTDVTADSYEGSVTHTRYPSPNHLNKQYIYIGADKDEAQDTYINLSEGMAIKYDNKNYKVTEVKLTSSMILFLETLIHNPHQIVSKGILCKNIFPDYYAEDHLNDDKRLQDLKSRVTKIIPALKGCMITHSKEGYSIRLPQRPL